MQRSSAAVGTSYGQCNLSSQRHEIPHNSAVKSFMENINQRISNDLEFFYNGRGTEIFKKSPVDKAKEICPIQAEDKIPLPELVDH